METWAIVLLIIGVILVIAGIAVGVYFLVRPKATPKSHTPSRPGSGGSGSGSGGGASGGGFVTGDFSISPGSDPSLFLTFTPGDVLYAVLGKDPKVPCDNYSFRNVQNYVGNSGSSYPLASALVSNAKSNIGGYDYPVNLTTNAFGGGINGQAMFSDDTIPTSATVLNWKYDPVAKTWCGSEEMYQNQCLYRYGSNVNVENITNVGVGSQGLSKSGFIWNNVPAIGGALCSA